MAGCPWGGYAVIMSERGCLSCGVEQLETGGLSGGGSGHNNPSMKCFQLRKKKKKEKREEQTFTVTTADVADDGGFMN